MKNLVIIFTVLIFLGVGGSYLYVNKSIPEVDIKFPPVDEKEHLDLLGLEWTDDIPGVNEWSVSESYCEKLSTEGGLKYNVEWRLPTKEELLNLYKEAQNDLTIKSLNSLGYWTSENTKDGFVIVVNGNLKHTAEGYFLAKNGNHRARCVR